MGRTFQYLDAFAHTKSQKMGLPPPPAPHLYAAGGSHAGLLEPERLPLVPALAAVPDEAVGDGLAARVLPTDEDRLGRQHKRLFVVDSLKKSS